MIRIKDDDPRLRGLPVGGVFWRKKSPSWWATIMHGKERVYGKYVHVKKYGGDVAAAKQAAELLLLQANDDLGLMRNKRRVLEDGNVEMDIGRGNRMRFSPDGLDKLKEYCWYLDGKGYYAKTKINGKPVLCHRFLMNAREGEIVDHRDGDKLNNTTSNLRLVSARVSSENRKLRKDSTTGVIGVTVRKDVDGNPLSYEAYWGSKGKNSLKRGMKNFAVSKYVSAEVAMAKAAAYRQKMEKKYDIQSRRRSMRQAMEEDNEEEEEEVVNFREVASSYFRQGERSPVVVAELSGIKKSIIRYYFRQFNSGKGFEKQNHIESKEKLRVQREMIELLYRQGFPAAEAAEQSGANAGTVKVWYRKLKCGAPNLQPRMASESFKEGEEGDGINMEEISRKRKREDEDRNEEEFRPLKKQHTLDELWK